MFIIEGFFEDTELHNGDIHAIDYKSKRIFSIKNHHWQDITKECQRMAKSKTKSDTLGARWFKEVEAGHYKESKCTILKTDNAQEFADFMNKIIILQMRHAANVAEQVKYSCPHVWGLSGYWPE